MARLTRFERVTSSSAGKRSNPLSYRRTITLQQPHLQEIAVRIPKPSWRREDLNLARALPYYRFSKPAPSLGILHETTVFYHNWRDFAPICAPISPEALISAATDALPASATRS